MRFWRINLILAFLFVFGLVVIGKLFFIQVLQADLYKALALGLSSGDTQQTEERGEIFLKNGKPLAINKHWPLVFASPEEMKNKNAAAEKLANILNLEKAYLLEKFKKDSLYVPLKKKITDKEKNKIENLQLEGIYLGEERGRYYPQEKLASHLVGFLGAQNKGQYGLEGYHNEALRKGKPLYLTVDYSIQFKAEQLLRRAKEDLEIEGGQIVVIEPSSGKVLAMADFPNFNPNKYTKYANQGKSEIFQNSATQKIFEPGSVFKPITMAAALNEGKITPSTTYEDPGTINIDDWTISNYDGRVYQGKTTMTKVLEKSINTGAVFAQQQLGQYVFKNYIEKFGIFEPTGISLKETVPGNKEFKEGRKINYVTASFGQGIEMTPIQLVRAYSVIANGGELVTPFLKEGGNPEEGQRVISSKAASQLTAMLISVVENGFAKSAQIPGYYVAGKTGTAQISWSALEKNKSGYSSKTWQSFMGFAPAFNPEFLILVKLDNPKTKTAEYSAVPIFQELGKYIIDYYQIAPDYQ